MALSLRSLIRHQMSGEVYVADYESEDSETIVAIAGPLHHSDYRDADGELRSLDEMVNLDGEDVEWANSQPWSPMTK